MSDLAITALVTLTLFCTAFNISWWLYGRTLSETFPVLVVVAIMLTTIYCFFIAFKLLFVEICNKIFSPQWGYVADYGEFIPYAKDIAQVLAGVLTIGIAILLYKEEGKITGGRHEGVGKEREYRRWR